MVYLQAALALSDPHKTCTLLADIAPAPELSQDPESKEQSEAQAKQTVVIATLSDSIPQCSLTLKITGPVIAKLYIKGNGSVHVCGTIEMDDDLLDLLGNK